MMFRCRFFLRGDFSRFSKFTTSLLPLFSSFPFFSLFRIVLRRESEHLKAVRFISMLIYICIFARFFQHFRDFHFLPLTHLASAYPYTRCSCVKFRKRQFFSLFLSLLPSLFLSISLSFYIPPSPATLFFHLPRFYQTQWTLGGYCVIIFFFTCTGRFSVIADSFESRSFGEVQLPTSFVLSQDRLILDSRNRENPLVSRRYVGQWYVEWKQKERVVRSWRGTTRS